MDITRQFCIREANNSLTVLLFNTLYLTRLLTYLINQSKTTTKFVSGEGSTK